MNLYYNENKRDRTQNDKIVVDIYEHLDNSWPWFKLFFFEQCILKYGFCH